MWAGGKITFTRNDNDRGRVTSVETGRKVEEIIEKRREYGRRKNGLSLNGSRAACLERITDVSVRGRPGDEKVFVEIERRIGRVGNYGRDKNIRKRFLASNTGFDKSNEEEEEDQADNGVALTERRTLAFMRERLLGPAWSRSSVSNRVLSSFDDEEDADDAVPSSLSTPGKVLRRTFILYFSRWNYFFPITKA